MRKYLWLLVLVIVAVPIVRLVLLPVFAANKAVSSAEPPLRSSLLAATRYAHVATSRALTTAVVKPFLWGGPIRYPS